MILLQFLHRDPVGISYLFGCGGRAAGAVVDPVGTVEPYLLAAEAAGMRIHFVVDTHVHADHLSAGRQLAEAAGAEYVLSADAEVSFPFKAVRDGADRAHADGRRPRPHGAGGQHREGREGPVRERGPAQVPLGPCRGAARRLFRLGLRALAQRQPTSTIGFEKRFNKAFRIDDEEAFVATMIADILPHRRMRRATAPPMPAWPPPRPER